MAMKSWRWMCLWVGISGLAFFEAAVARANPFENRMSMETTTIELSVGSVRYKIPRNYLFEMDHWDGGPQESVSLRVRYPDFKPYSEETKRCMLKQEPCRILEFHITLPQLPSDDRGFESMRDLFRNRTPDAGPFGFELYHLAQNEYYRKALPDRVFAFSCFPFDNHGIPDGICQAHTRARCNGVVAYFFSRQQLEDAERVDTGLRDLVDSFAVGGVD